MNNRFAFITTRRVVPGSAGPVLDPAPRRPAALTATLLRRLPPARVTRITGVHSPHAYTEGWLMTAPLSNRRPAGLSEHILRRKLIRAGRRAERMGARLAGLEIMAGQADAVGVAVAGSLGIAVTTGGSFTVAATLEGVRAAAALMGCALETAGVMILGATGPLGAACARILAREGVDRITLVDRDRFRLDSLAGCILYESGVSCKATSRPRKAAFRADVVIALDGDVAPLPEAQDLKPGAVLYDATQSQSLARRVSALRREVLVIGGAVFEAPGEICSGFQPGPYPLCLTSACLAETMLLALERRFENFSLGSRLRVEKVEEMRRLAAKHGFKPAGLHRFGQPVLPREIARIREEAAAKMPETQGD